MTEPPGAAGRRAFAAILVVDDEAMIGYALKRALAPHRVHTTTSGATALRWLQDGLEVDLVFCDLMMPEMNGLEFVEKLADLLPELASRVVFLTGSPESPLAKHVLENGSQRVLEKPFEMAELHALVRNALIRPTR